MSTQRNQVLSVKEARNFLINYQGLNTVCRYTQEKGVISYFEKVGCIQYDPLNVVGRNADLTLQSRVKGYHADMLYKLLYQKRTVIDAWDKMMALYLQKDWPYFKRLRTSKGKEIEAVLARRNSLQALEHLDEVREHIKKHGPSQSSSIDIGICNPGKWGSKKLASAAMDYLFNIGELGIYSKNNVQRTYEFTEKLLKKEILEESDPFQSDDEFYEWYVKRRIGSVGMLWACNGGGWLGHFISDSDIRNSKIKRLLEKGEIEVAVLWDYNSLGYRSQILENNANAHFEVSVPTDGAIQSGYCTIINAYTKRPYAAALAREYILSDEGQINLAKGYARPIRDDVELPEDVKAMLLPDEQYKNARFIEDQEAWDQAVSDLSTSWQEEVVAYAQ